MPRLVLLLEKGPLSWRDSSTLKAQHGRKLASEAEKIGAKTWSGECGILKSLALLLGSEQGLKSQGVGPATRIAVSQLPDATAVSLGVVLRNWPYTGLSGIDAV